MDQIISAIANDLKINKYLNEPDQEYIFRVCYSALGLWCLATGLTVDEFEKGTSKNSFTIKIGELLEQYTNLFPFIKEKFINKNNPDENWSRFLRVFYEETGYLLTNEKNHDFLSNRERTSKIGNEFLYFGIPQEICSVNGLGIYSQTPRHEFSIKDIIFRDCISPDQLVDIKYDSFDFQSRDCVDLQFFNPFKSQQLSKSMDTKVSCNYSIAVDSNGTYYRVIKEGESLLFCEEPANINNSSLFSYEYRRLYYALKHYYKSPIKATIERLDQDYYSLYIPSHLPNREYYMLLLMAWPKGNAFNKQQFVFKSNAKVEIISLLKSLGVSILGG